MARSSNQTIRAADHDGAVIAGSSFHQTSPIPHGFFKLFFPIFKMLFRKWEKGGAERMRKTLNERYGDSKAAA